jgi:DNA-binding winged helix-turn-helix (wHTH) protein/Tol biopolymer transport system component
MGHKILRACLVIAEFSGRMGQSSARRRSTAMASASPTGNHRLVQLGEFELDRSTGELRKGEVKVRLQEQPLKILELLLEQPGELVSREQIQQRLWPDGTFVEFDHSVNAAIKRLREALGDSVETPQFIETLPKRGYRLIVPVEQVSPVGGIPAGREALPVPKRIRVAAGAVCLAIMAGAAFYLLRRPLPQPKLSGFVQITDDGHRKVGPLLSDGARLYFTQPSSSGWILAEVSVAGGEPVAISTPFQDPQPMDISPDGSSLLVGTNGLNDKTPLWIVPVLGGAPRRLGNLTVNDAAWSPDGKEIAYGQDFDLYVAKANGTDPRKLVTAPGIVYAPDWSPDARVIRFSVAKGFHLGTLWEVTTTGGEAYPLLAGSKNPPTGCCGRWTSDGRYYVFQSEIGGTELWAIPERRGLFRKAAVEPVQLISGPLNIWGSVSSRDGKKEYIIGGSPRGQLVRYDLKSQQFVEYLSGISAVDLDFSRDGQWVTYLAYPEGTLWRSKADGTERLQLTFAPLVALSPRWSADGRRIAYQLQAPTKLWKIHFISRNGGTSQEAMPGRGPEFDPSWSPDGNSLAFGINNPLCGPGSAKPFAIRVLDINTGKVSTLPGSEGLYAPLWSPDGRYIAAVDAYSQTVMLFDFKYQTWVILRKAVLGFLSWSRDSRYVYFDGVSGGEPIFYRASVTDRKLERVVSLKEIRRPTSESWGAWLGLTPDDSPLVLRDVTSQEIYALDWQAR